MHVIEIGQVGEQRARKQLQPAAGIRRVVAQQAAPHRIGNCRGSPLRPAVLSLPAMPDNHQPRIAPVLGNALGDTQQSRDVGGIVLAVAVERRDPAPACELYPAADRGALAIAARVPDQTDRRLGGLRLHPANLGGGRVLAAVIDIDDFVSSNPVQRGGDFGDQRCDIAGLVFDRDDNRKVHRAAIRPLSAPPSLSARAPAAVSNTFGGT